MKPFFAVFQDADRWVWQLRHTNNKILCRCNPKGFTTKDSAISNIRVTAGVMFGVQPKYIQEVYISRSNEAGEHILTPRKLVQIRVISKPVVRDSWIQTAEEIPEYAFVGV